MKSTKNLLVLVSILATATFGFLHERMDDIEAQKQIEEVVLNSYIHGAFNELNPDAMLAGFHQDFAIFSASGEELDKYPIHSWAASVKKRKNSPDFNPKKNIWDHNFAILDVTGGAATVKVELSKNGKQVYSDYLSLLQFDSGWKIVAKVYHKH